MTDAALPQSLQLGLWAPTLTEQGFGRLLSLDDLEKFEDDDKAISRLHARGALTYSEHVRARERLAKIIKAALALRAAPIADQSGSERADAALSALEEPKVSSPTPTPDEGSGMNTEGEGRP